MVRGEVAGIADNILELQYVNYYIGQALVREITERNDLLKKRFLITEVTG